MKKMKKEEIKPAPKKVEAAPAKKVEAAPAKKVEAAPAKKMTGGCEPTKR